MSMQIAYSRSRAGMAGDPGLGGFLKKAVGVVGGLAKSPLGGILRSLPGVGTVAGIAGVVGGIVGGGGSRKVAQVMGGSGVSPVSLPGVGMIPAPDFRVGPVGVHVPGGAPGVGVSVGSTGFGMFPTGAQGNGRPAGYRPNKSSYFLRDGTFVPAGTKWVKARRRNPLNPRALDRAMGRLTSAKSAARKINRISIRPAKSCR